MKNRIAKERIIFDNYNRYFDEWKQKYLEEFPEYEDISDDSLINIFWDEESMEWEDAKIQLDNFFDNAKLLLTGNIGRWNGVSSGFDTFDTLDSLLDFALEDCAYFKIWDENGHLYVCGSHHDGTVSYEIKILTDKGKDYLENWEYSWNDKRTNTDVHKALIERYSRLPNFCHKIWGCKLREYEPITKEKLIIKINNQARSFY